MRESTFFKSVILLTSGVAIANLVTFAALPLLTRLYTPEDFSVLAVFSGVLSTLAVASCLRFDIAIPIPASDDDALNLLVLAVISAVIVAVVIALLTLALWPFVDEVPRLAQVAPYAWLLPIGLLISGLYLASQLHYVRHREFRLIAGTRIAQSGLAATVQIACGWTGIAPLGLLLGQVINAGAGALILFQRLLRSGGSIRDRVRSEHLRRLLREYRRFPTLSTLEALANASGIFLPVILIAMLDMGSEAGFLALAMTLMQAPMSLIGGAVAQVFLSRSPDSFRNRELGNLTQDVLIGLIRSGVGPILFAGIVAPGLVGIVFGEEWDRSGVLIAWMAPWFVLQFLTAPVSMALHVTGHQRRALAVQVLGLVTRSVMVLGASAIGLGVGEAYAVSGFVFYAFFLAVILQTTGARLAVLASARGVWSIPLLWCMLGLLVAALVSLIR
jgi:O-antigen/teichoic acid export membrane protein